MVEGEGLSGAAALEHQRRKLLVLILDDFKVGFGQPGGVARRADDRLHAQLRKAEVEHLLDVLEEIRVRVREGAAHVVVFPAARRDEFLEFRHDFLPASVACVIDAVAVVDLLSSVEAQNNVAHLAVREVDHVVVDQHAVRRQCEAEVLAGLLLAAARVGDEFLDDVEVHQRLAAEEIDLEVASAA